MSEHTGIQIHIYIFICPYFCLSSRPCVRYCSSVLSILLERLPPCVLACAMRPTIGWRQPTKRWRRVENPLTSGGRKERGAVHGGRGGREAGAGWGVAHSSLHRGSVVRRRHTNCPTVTSLQLAASVSDALRCPCSQASSARRPAVCTTRPPRLSLSVR